MNALELENTEGVFYRQNNLGATAWWKGSLNAREEVIRCCEY